MSIELKMLGLAIVLGLVQLILAAQFSTKQRGMDWNLSARDQKAPELTGVAGRLNRAFSNFMETFPFFAAAALTISALKASTDVSVFGAQMYVAGRVLYVPIYAVGTPVIRTVVWGFSTVGILLVLSALLTVP